MPATTVSFQILIHSTFWCSIYSITGIHIILGAKYSFFYDWMNQAKRVFIRMRNVSSLQQVKIRNITFRKTWLTISNRLLAELRLWVRKSSFLCIKTVKYKGNGIKMYFVSNDTLRATWDCSSCNTKRRKENVVRNYDLQRSGMHQFRLFYLGPTYIV
jgi:hypothetical protein